MIDNILVVMAVVLFSGLLMSKLAKKLNVPNVTAYLLAGLLIGPAIPALFGIENGGLISLTAIHDLKLIADIELGFIAFIIGTDFKMSYFKRVGWQPIIIAFAESGVAVVLVAGTVFALTGDMAFALTLGAISAATAPAATILVLRQYKAQGELTETLMSVVAIDDASTLIYFGFATTVAIALVQGFDLNNLTWAILKPFVEVFISIGIGVALGFILTLIVKWFSYKGNRTSWVLGFVFAVSGTFQILMQLYNLNVSPLLALMAVGAVFTNTSDQVDGVMELVDRIMGPLIILFFVLSGADLDLTKIIAMGFVGLAYIVARFAGKWIGAYTSGVATKSSEKVKKWLGFGLLPQGGVAIGLSLVAAAIIPEKAPEIRAIVLTASLVCDFIGPILTRYAILKSGEGQVPHASVPAQSK